MTGVVGIPQKETGAVAFVGAIDDTVRAVVPLAALTRHDGNRFDLVQVIDALLVPHDEQTGVGRQCFQVLDLFGDGHDVVLWQMS
jgi:hypothetical protein